MSQGSEAVVRRGYKELYTAMKVGNWDGVWRALDQFWAPDMVHYGMPPGFQSRDGFKQVVSSGFGGASEFDGGLLDVIAQDDKVVVYWETHFTHSGEIMGVPATGKRVTVRGVDISRLENGKIKEVWQIQDNFGLLQQLGAIPTPEHTTA